MVREEIWDDEEGRSIASSFFSFVVSFGGGVDGGISCKILEIRRYGTFCVICPFGLAFIIYLLMGASFGVHRRIPKGGSFKRFGIFVLFKFTLS